MTTTQEIASDTFQLCQDIIDMMNTIDTKTSRAARFEMVKLRDLVASWEGNENPDNMLRIHDAFQNAMREHILMRFSPHISTTELKAVHARQMMLLNELSHVWRIAINAAVGIAQTSRRNVVHTVLASRPSL